MSKDPQMRAPFPRCSLLHALAVNDTVMRAPAVPDHVVAALRRWTTPLGLPISQPYRSNTKALIRTVANSIAMEAFDSLPVARQKQKSALPPNFVHSLDATHLMMTAIECNRRGLAFAGVHDSYWTHAGDVDVARDVLRAQFVKLYTQPLLRNLRDELVEANPYIYAGDKATLEVPPQGDLDIHLVANATYFFN